MIYDPPKIMKTFPKVDDIRKELHSDDKRILSVEEEREENGLRNSVTED